MYAFLGVPKFRYKDNKTVILQILIVLTYIYYAMFIIISGLAAKQIIKSGRNVACITYGKNEEELRIKLKDLLQ